MSKITLSHTITKNDIDALAVGDELPNCFGRIKKVTAIHHKGVDVNGRAFACYYQEFGETSQMSGSIKEGQRIHSIVQYCKQ